MFPKKLEHLLYSTLLENCFKKLICDFGKCPNQKTHESESAGFTLAYAEIPLTKEFNNNSLSFLDGFP